MKLQVKTSVGDDQTTAGVATDNAQRYILDQAKSCTEGTPDDLRANEGVLRRYLWI